MWASHALSGEAPMRSPGAEPKAPQLAAQCPHLQPLQPCPLTCVLAAMTAASAMIWLGVYTVDARTVRASSAPNPASGGSAISPCRQTLGMTY